MVKGQISTFVGLLLINYRGENKLLPATGSLVMVAIYPHWYVQYTCWCIWLLWTQGNSNYYVNTRIIRDQLHSKPLSIGWSDDSNSWFENILAQRSDKTKLVAFRAHGGCQASFKACSMDLGVLGKHHFSIVLLESGESIIRLLHLSLFLDSLSSSHCSDQLV